MIRTRYVRWVVGALMACVGVTSTAGEFTLAANQDMLVMPRASIEITGRPQRAPNTAYAVGQVVVEANVPYVCAVAGTSAAGAVSYGGEIVQDGTCVMLKSWRGARTGFGIQHIAGDGVVLVTLGPVYKQRDLVLTQVGAGVVLDAYQDALAIKATNDSVTVTIFQW